jgi:uncharacterized protein CbrC (UPF0167 family)
MTGSIIPSETLCVCCNKRRGYVYCGPVYAIESFDNNICPWCIYDGSAHDKFDARFTDEADVGGDGEWDEVAKEIIEEVSLRTPGFCGWQQHRWWTHCGDAGRFLGPMGRKELEDYGELAIQAIRESTGLDEGPEWNEFFKSLDKDKSPATAYLFQCTKCHRLGGYEDNF